MVRREVLFCTTLILIGTMDLITTLVGILFFGATESNPILSNMTQSNMLLFSVVKISAIIATGFIFYKAEIQTKLSAKSSPFVKKFLNAGYVISLLMLTLVVLNNFNTILKIA